MKVNKKIYDWYQQVFKGENSDEKELLLIAILQQGWAQQYNDESTAYMDKFLNLGEYDLEIAHFINQNKMEFVDAILHDNIHAETFFVKYTVVDYIEKDGTTHIKMLYAKKSSVGGAVDFGPWEGSIIANPQREFTLEEIKSYGLDSNKYVLEESK